MKNIIEALKQNFGQNDSLPAASVKREEIIRFIVHALKPYVDEKAITLTGLRFYILCKTKEEEEMAGVALYLEKPGYFKKEQLERKLINNYIQVAENWLFETHIMKVQLPDNIIQDGNFGLSVIRNNHAVGNNYSTAVLRTLIGQTETPDFQLNPATQLKYYIGRSKNPKIASGKIHPNDIVFLTADDQQYDEKKAAGNLHVSRNHAIIIYNPQTDRFLLYPDKGGLPESGNKIKIFTSDDKVKSLNIPGVPHELQYGDQIELGGEAILEFSRG
jgi:hypothetical protein